MKFDDERSSSEDDSEEKNTLWKNPDVHLTKYPEPFGDTDDENVYEFLDTAETTLYYN